MSATTKDQDKANVCMTLRLPTVLYARVKAAARVAGVSINTYIKEALKRSS